ncbi:hypothetical protein N7454_006042 [Penicillium verhagenii]|nr:hypothetical protein N7454_006042 [Penicillium verhagenii]
MQTPDSDPVITCEEVKILEEGQIFIPSHTSGKRKVSVTFTPPTSGPSSRSSGSVTMEWHGFDDRKTEFEIPTEKKSIITLELMSF